MSNSDENDKIVNVPTRADAQKKNIKRYTFRPISPQRKPTRVCVDKCYTVELG